MPTQVGVRFAENHPVHCHFGSPRPCHFLLRVVSDCSMQRFLTLRNSGCEYPVSRHAECSPWNSRTNRRQWPRRRIRAAQLISQTIKTKIGIQPP